MYVYCILYDTYVERSLLYFILYCIIQMVKRGTVVVVVLVLLHRHAIHVY